MVSAMVKCVVGKMIMVARFACMMDPEVGYVLFC